MQKPGRAEEDGLAELVDIPVGNTHSANCAEYRGDSCGCG